MSVIVHGRNDAHGYNLHKRVALSLNCLSELLVGNDEIIFVDWNTASELPTLPEAIADTLTAACRKHLRVLRVQPHQHRRFARLTHLPVLDAPARNVAIRRARPENQWLLSTTTDVILVPRRPGQKLREVIEPLEPALYHLPRFDVPEGLWEAFDRLDPVRAIARCADWGHRLHLNEVVESDPVVKYEGPGDFQLLPMFVARQIGGFDERMLFTHHMDSNLAKRVSLLLGPVRTLLDQLFLYHCNHYRQGSVHHGPSRAENSWRRFVIDVDSPSPAGQTDSWGLACEPIEEIAIAPTGESPLARALANATAEPDQDYWTVSNDADCFNQLDYRPEHVLPFVTDLIAMLPRDAEIGAFATTTSLLRLITRTWHALGFLHPVMVSDERLAPGLPVSVVPEEAILARAAALIFEFGSEASDNRVAQASPLARLSGVAEAFHRAAARERELARRGHPAQQRFIVVNAINTLYERLVANHLAFTYTPFTGRVRHGVVAVAPDPLTTDVASLACWLARRLNRAPPVPLQEVLDALDLISGSSGQSPPPISAPVAALFEHPRLGEAVGMSPQAWQQQRLAIQRVRRNAALVDPAFTVQVAGVASPRPLSKFAAIDDWECPDWLDQLRACDEAAETANFFRRHRATWELGQLLYAAEIAAPPAKVARARLILPARGSVAGQLARRYSAVEILAAGGMRASRVEDIWPDPAPPFPLSRMAALDGTAADAIKREPAELVILPDNAILAHGLVGFPILLEWLDRWLAIGGVILFAAEVVIAGGRAPDRFPPSLVAGGLLQDIVARLTGLQAIGDSDWSLSEPTLDRLATAGTPGEGEPHFVIQIGEIWSTTAFWAWQKTAATRPHRWERLRDALADHLAD